MFTKAPFFPDMCAFLVEASGLFWRRDTTKFAEVCCCSLLCRETGDLFQNLVGSPVLPPEEVL